MPPIDYTETLLPFRVVLRLDRVTMKAHELPGGKIAFTTDLRWYLGTGRLPAYAVARTALMLVDADNKEVSYVTIKRG